MSGCLKSSYGILCLVTSWMLIAIGLMFLHLGAAVTGFVTGDVAGRFWIQRRYHVSREEAFRQPLQVRSLNRPHLAALFDPTLNSARHAMSRTSCTSMATQFPLTTPNAAMMSWQLEKAHI